MLRRKQENALSRGIGNFAGGIFFIEWWESDKKWFWTFETFSKLKTRFCKYWTSIKIKTSMTCMYKDYKLKIKMVQEQWLKLKMKSLWGSNMKMVGNEPLIKGNNNLVKGSYCRRIFSSGSINKILTHGGLPFSASGLMGEFSH